MSELKIPFEKITFNALSLEDQRLIEEAVHAMEKAHAPYSHFKVGSALIDTNKKITSGNNQENAAYPSGLCAERVALFKAKSESTTPIETLTVVARDSKNNSADAFCCGACRQVLMEYASLQDLPIRVLMGTKEGDYLILNDARFLMPFGFDLKNLQL